MGQNGDNRKFNWDKLHIRDEYQVNAKSTPRIEIVSILKFYITPISTNNYFISIEVLRNI